MTESSTANRTTNKINLSERLLDFGARVVKLTEELPNTLAGKRIGDQLLRSGTSVGANYQEAQAAESKRDFLHKLQLALKELRESNYWLKLLSKAEIIRRERLTVIQDESEQLKAILSKAVITAKKKQVNSSGTAS
jgi:four helix bundle protein